MKFQKEVITEADWSSLNLSGLGVHPFEVPVLPAQGAVDKASGSIFLRLKVHPMAARDGCETCILVMRGTLIRIDISMSNPTRAVWTVARNFERQKVAETALLAEAAVRCYYESMFPKLEFSVYDRLAIRTDEELVSQFDLLANVYLSCAELREAIAHTERIKEGFRRSWLQGKLRLGEVLKPTPLKVVGFRCVSL